MSEYADEVEDRAYSAGYCPPSAAEPPGAGWSEKPEPESVWEVRATRAEAECRRLRATLAAARGVDRLVQTMLNLANELSQAGCHPAYGDAAQRIRERLLELDPESSASWHWRDKLTEAIGDALMNAERDEAGYEPDEDARIIADRLIVDGWVNPPKEQQL
jgi:hypothetical protein